MVREFKLINEKGQQFSMMDIKKHCLLTQPTGLGYDYITDYEQVGNSFISNIRKIGQGQIVGQVNFLKYDNYKALIDFIETSDSLRFSYKIPFESTYKEYFKDVQIQSITKTEIQPNEVMSETSTFDCLSLWYEEIETVYDMTAGENEMRWDFRWDSRYISFDVRSLIYDNKGHVEAPIQIEIDGAVDNPKIEIIVNETTIANLTIPVSLTSYEKLLYSSKTGDIYIRKQLADGTYENLFTKQYIDITNNNIFKLPLGASEIRFTADDEITSAKLIIYPQYKAV